MRRKAFCAALIAAAWFNSSFAHAATCNTTITVSASSTMTLTDDYTQDSDLSISPCFQLQNGATLDLNGHTITRTMGPGDSASEAAIKCVSSGTTVHDGANVKGVITGEGWTYGIKGCENVYDVVIDGGGNDGAAGWILYGIYGGTTAVSNISTNVILKTVEGVNVPSFLNNTSFVSNNSFSEVSSPIIVTGTGSSPGALVENNVIRTFGYRAIAKSGTGYVRIRKNLIDVDGRDPFYDGEPCLNITATHSTVADNYCDCVDAFSAPQCPIDLPYNLQWY